MSAFFGLKYLRKVNADTAAVAESLLLGTRGIGTLVAVGPPTFSSAFHTQLKHQWPQQRDFTSLPPPKPNCIPDPGISLHKRELLIRFHE